MSISLLYRAYYSVIVSSTMASRSLITFYNCQNLRVCVSRTSEPAPPPPLASHNKPFVGRFLCSSVLTSAGSSCYRSFSTQLAKARCMATTVVMVVSSPHRPKLAPKPSPAKQLDAVSPQPPPLRSPLSRQEFFGPRETQNVVPASDDNKRPDSVHHHGCVNQTSTCAECRNADPSPVNIDSVILRRGRRTKAPKPLPYLEPIVTYLARSDRQPAVNGRPGVAQQRRRKRVTFAAPSSPRSLKSRQRRVARTHSEKLSLGRRRELAYLVVDLQSGSIASCSGKLNTRS